MDERVTTAIELMAESQKAMQEMIAQQQQHALDARSAHSASSLRSTLASSVNTKGMVRVGNYHGEKDKF